MRGGSSTASLFRRVTSVGLSCLVVVMVGCGSDSSSEVVLRDADGVQVMSPEAVAAMKSSIPSANTAPVGSAAVETTSGSGDADPMADTPDPGSDGGGDTIPLNQDDRPPELKLFEAYSKFKGCIEDNGETIRGDLQDRNNPAYQDPNYMQIVSTCAAKSDIVNVLQEVQASQAEMSPDEIKSRNESFKKLSDCLKKKGWTVETVTDSNGLINPRVFRAADGSLNQRDLDSCLTETGIADAIENGS